jgi:hypothetical protein
MLLDMLYFLTSYDRTLVLTNVDQALLLITRSGTYAKTILLYFGQMTGLNGLITPSSVGRRFLLEDATNFKIF